MATPSPRTRDLARQLLAASHPRSAPQVYAGAVVVSEKLRISLTRFAGADGFDSLQRRALALATGDEPLLKGLTVDTDGRLEGWQLLAALPKTDAAAADAVSGARAAAETLVAHLLELLDTFIGRVLTLRMVRESWPDLSLEEPHSTIEANR